MRTTSDEKDAMAKNKNTVEGSHGLDGTTPHQQSEGK